ncbi:hypothetical protein MYIN104542_20200 [Mycobacterium intermedium]
MAALTACPEAVTGAPRAAGAEQPRSSAVAAVTAGAAVSSGTAPAE